MGTVVVSGSAEAAEPVVAALRMAGAKAVAVTGAEQLVAALKMLPPRSLGAYVQLPVLLEPGGDTVVSRVRSLLEDGLLTRFALADAVVPALAKDASVVLVGGHTPVETSAPDDQPARLAMLNVLAHAIRADRAPVRTRVRVLDHTQTATAIAQVALTSGAAPDRPAPPPSHEAARAYADWRSELLGLVSVGF